ncbi:MAG: siderophore biosynthesis protein [Synechococcales cyanobacterium M58_A2018_015]|nr:siderophore biosynthesis protein [Synechococcales cyanobacterium M58_A2018_015]
MWKGFHWAFFIQIQGLIISLRRFEASLVSGDLSLAHTELTVATRLMLASGAAMQLAGSFSPQEYAQQVRPSMTPPRVQSDNFSGLMSWEHAVLMQLWQRLRSVFATLPADLDEPHQRFVEAYFALVTAHKAVCQKFGGDEAGSLRFESGNAVDTLDKFAQIRWQALDPNRRTADRCPFHLA